MTSWNLMMSKQHSKMSMHAKGAEVTCALETGNSQKRKFKKTRNQEISTKTQVRERAFKPVTIRNTHPSKKFVGGGLINLWRHVLRKWNTENEKLELRNTMFNP